MDKVLSVEDFIGGLLKHGGGNGSWKMGLGRRTDSEAAFQEFLKRIPSATALSSQAGEESKPMFASGSNASLFGFGSSNLECGGVPRVASLDMLRNMVDQDEKNRSIKPSEAAVQFTGAPEQPSQSPGSLRQQPNANTQLFQPSGGALAHPTQSLAQSAALAGPAIPSLPVGSAAAMGGMLQVPGTLLAYQNLQHSPQLLPVQGVQHGLQTAPTTVKGAASHSDTGTVGVVGEEHDKMEQRRARRMLSNRESARRSRKRKQEQLSELEQQVKVLEDKNENLESQCQAAAVHVQNILADKQRLENENQHLMSILQQLQKSIGEDQIRKHLPAALGGAGPIPSAARAEGDFPEGAAAPDAAPVKVEAVAVACAGAPDNAVEREAPQAGHADAEASAADIHAANGGGTAEHDGEGPMSKAARIQREPDTGLPACDQ